MIMQETKDYINKAFGVELQNAIMQYGDKYASTHEAYAILKEEIEEAKVEFELIENNLVYCWNLIKKSDPNDGRQYNHLQSLKEHTTNAIAELLQVLAVVQKYKNTLGVSDDV